MTLGELENIRDIYRLQLPPSSLSFLEKISTLEWLFNSDEQLEIYCEILLRINADIIMSHFEKCGDERVSYGIIFNKISSKIELSNLLKSGEFSEYFYQFIKYRSDLWGIND